MVFVLILLIFITLTIASAYGVFKYKNRRLKPDYFEYFKSQDSVPEGKVGIFVTGLIMPEKIENAFFYNITKKVFSAIIPWPFRLFAQADKGVALLDPVRHHEEEEFTPTKLEDPFGNDCDLDGEPYIKKYKKGQVVWGPPSKNIYLDHGYFIYTGRKGGMPTLSGKIINRARLWYYGSGTKQKKLPHQSEMSKVIGGALDRIRRKYGGLECSFECSMYYSRMKSKLFCLLEAGCDTIVLSSPMIVYSHFEEFNSSFYHCFEYIHEWERRNPGKKTKVIIAPPMGHFQPLRRAFLEMLKDRLDTLPDGSAVAVALKVHGMPWDHFKWEAWLELAPPYRDKLLEECKKLLADYNFSKTRVVSCQDEFANPIWDPKEKYLSTNRAYKDAVRDGFDYVIGIPIEMIAENSDTLFQHAQENYHGFEGYDVYDEIDYYDWSIPYVRKIKTGKTTIIYNGVPVGKYQSDVIEALFQALDSVLSQENPG